MIFGKDSTDGDVPRTFNELWWKSTKHVYKWTLLPTVLFFFFMMGGWDAMRVSWDYKETTGIVTNYRCGKSGVLEYTFTANDEATKGRNSASVCGKYNPGDTVHVFYSTRHPQISVVSSIPPGRLWVKQLIFIVISVLVLVPIATVISLASQRFRGE